MHAFGHTLRRLLATAFVLALAAGGAAACGGSDDDDSGDGGAMTSAPTTEQPAQTGGETNGGAPAAGDEGEGATTRLTIVAQESGGLAFDRSELTARAGTVTIVMDNPSDNALPHAVEIEGMGVEEAGDTVDPGPDQSVATADLRPGRYVFLCPVDGHAEAGMRGTLTVR